MRQARGSWLASSCSLAPPLPFHRRRRRDWYQSRPVDSSCQASRVAAAAIHSLRPFGGRLGNSQREAGGGSVKAAAPTPATWLMPGVVVSGIRIRSAPRRGLAGFPIDAPPALVRGISKIREHVGAPSPSRDGLSTGSPQFAFQTAGTRYGMSARRGRSKIQSPHLGVAALLAELLFSLPSSYDRSNRTFGIRRVPDGMRSPYAGDRDIPGTIFLFGYEFLVRRWLAVRVSHARLKSTSSRNCTKGNDITDARRSPRN